LTNKTEEIKRSIENEFYDIFRIKVIDKKVEKWSEKIELIDDSGYKYYYKKSDLKDIKKNNGILRPFTPKNHFALENIKLWLKNNRKNYKLLSTDFNSSADKLKFKCDKNHIFYMRFNNMKFLNQRCPFCMGNAKFTLEDAEYYFDKKNFKLLATEYKNLTTKMPYICNKHKEIGIQYATLYSVKKNQLICSECVNENKKKLYTKTQERFENEVFKIVKNEYTVLGRYKNTHTKILIRHNACDHEWEVEPNSFLYAGHRCPNCYYSRGEDKIKKYLDNNNISHEQQYRLDDCRYKKPLPFDFAIFDNKNMLKCLIEFDGRQHFEEVKAFGGRGSFKRTQKYDKIKTDYCKVNNILLIRIPYWELDNIEKILEENLKLAV